MRLLISMLALLVILSGCSNETATEIEENKNEVIDQVIIEDNPPLEIIQTDQEQEEVEESTKIIEPIEITQKNIQNYLNTTMTQDHIIDLLGSPNAKGKNSYSRINDGESLWRYDVINNSEYVIEENESIYKEKIDFEGVQEGNVQLQLFLTWNDDGTMQKVTSYYHENDKVMEYEQFEEVTTKELNESTFKHFSENEFSGDHVLDLANAKIGDKITGWTISTIRNESSIYLGGYIYYRVFVTFDGFQELSGKIGYSELSGGLYFTPDEKSKLLIPSLKISNTSYADIEFNSNFSEELQQELFESLYTGATATITATNFYLYHVDETDVGDVIVISDIKDIQFEE
ncbi:hypothetical protein [Chengkuizengella axinellae]|uniref:Outer membrane protein assembly factor BamE n=1 Tax=Chengkuizengella axinellae TaxID=3064388 RepID=A0ABT9J4K3_9BACL|nr:hypothetical protein [Chengkuizengella sp. 2205SS18-9]MDP5276544.1 hypothetical protein [Chengkuizengella sp. 2205SS18-9]